MRYAIFPAVICYVAVAANADTKAGAALDRVLKASVRNERVDYSLIKENHLSDVDTAIDAFAKVDPATLKDNERLAYYINLYNITMIKAVLDRGGVEFKPSGNDFQVFKDKIVQLRGETISLNDLENKVIRKSFNDPRVHAALVCGALSCPPLIDQAYTAATLDQRLDANVKNWLSDPNRNVVDDANKTLKLSQIFEWYAEDFGGRDNLAGWVGDKLGRDVSGYRVEFVPYDWSLNKP